MNDEISGILYDICWLLSTLNDRIVDIESRDCGYAQSNWKEINDVMGKVNELQSKIGG